MHFAAKNVLTLIILAVACVYAAPTALERRAPNLLVSLRESQPRTTQWHFALVIHAPGRITDGGTKNPVYHHVIDTELKCFVFQAKDGITVKNSHIRAAANLIPAKQEETNDALRDSAVAIFRSVPNSPITAEGGFPNCLDFAVNAVAKLHAAGYVSEADYAQFDQVRTDLAQSVRAKTDKGTVELTGQEYLCTRANRKCRGSAKKAHLKGKTSLNSGLSKKAHLKGKTALKSGSAKKVHAKGKTSAKSGKK